MSLIRQLMVGVKRSEAGSIGGRVRRSRLTPENKVRIARLGGLARARRLTSEQRKAIAARAACARWA